MNLLGNERCTGVVRGATRVRTIVKGVGQGCDSLSDVKGIKYRAVVDSNG